MKKFISVAIGILVIGAGILISKAFQSSAEGEARPSKPKVKPTVFAHRVQNGSVPIVIKASGPLMAKQRAELFAEVQGIFKSGSKPFKPGTFYQKGDIFLQMDGSEQYATLQAQKSTLYNLIATMLPDLHIDFPESFPAWEAYANGFDTNQPVPDLPAPRSNKEKVFVASKNVYTTFHNIKALELRQRKFILRAPFSGTLTESLVTPGTLVRPGQRLGEFVATGVYEMEVAIGISILPLMKVGKKVTVRPLSNTEPQWEGTVIRINPKVNRNSQTATIYLEVRGASLSEGMYLEAIIQAKEEQEAYEIDRSLLIKDTQVFVVVDSTLQLHTISPVYFNEQTAVVKGLPNGIFLLSKTVPGAFEGMPVKLYEEE